MKILLYNDGSPESGSAARFTALLGGNVHPTVTLLGVAEDESCRNDLLHSLGRTQETLQQAGIPADLLLKQGEPIPAIIRHTRGTQVDLVVIGTVRKSSGAGPHTVWRNAYRVIRAVAPPVLVVGGNPSVCSRILLCSSGRDDFDRAIKFVAELARPVGASVLMFHVFVEAPALYADFKSEDQDWLLRSGASLARTLRSQRELFESEGVRCELRLVHGCVTDEILKEIQTGEHDMLVVGTNPSGSPIESYILGDITRELISTVQIPTLVVRAETGHTGFRARLRRFGAAFLK